MNPQAELLHEIDAYCRRLTLCDYSSITWTEGQTIRALSLRCMKGDESVWQEFLDYLGPRKSFCWAIYDLLECRGWIETSFDHDTELFSYRMVYPALTDGDKSELLTRLRPTTDTCDEKPKSAKAGKIMYIEEKPGLAGHARIGRVTFSATRKTIYYAGRKLQSLKGAGYKANFQNVDSGLEYWISNCKKNGNDSLYPCVIEIDEDAREEYWLSIRKIPENVHLTKIRSEGKYAKRRPS